MQILMPYSFIFQLEDEIVSLRSSLLLANNRTREMATQMELQKKRTKQLITAWKVRLEDGQETVRNLRLEKDREMKDITSNLMLFQGELQREQKRIVKEFQEKENIITELQTKISCLKTANTKLLLNVGKLRKQIGQNGYQNQDAKNHSPVESVVKVPHVKRRVPPKLQDRKHRSKSFANLYEKHVPPSQLSRVFGSQDNLYPELDGHPESENQDIVSNLSERFGELVRVSPVISDSEDETTRRSAWLPDSSSSFDSLNNGCYDSELLSVVAQHFQDSPSSPESESPLFYDIEKEGEKYENYVDKKVDDGDKNDLDNPDPPLLLDPDAPELAEELDTISELYEGFSASLTRRHTMGSFFASHKSVQKPKDVKKRNKTRSRSLPQTDNMDIYRKLREQFAF